MQQRRRVGLRSCPWLAARALAPTTAGAATHVSPASIAAGRPASVDPPSPALVDLAPAAVIAAPTETFSATVEHVSGDGLDDLLLVRHWQETAQLLRQEADGFAPWAEFPLADRHDCASADVDGDGLRDVYCSVGATEPGGESSAEKANELRLQAPDGTFADVATEWGVADRRGGAAPSPSSTPTATAGPTCSSATAIRAPTPGPRPTASS